MSKTREQPSKASDAVAAVLDLLRAAGFVDDGVTREEAVRVPTRSVPLLGRSGGELATFGGRVRYAKPGTNVKATVGKRTTCIYRLADGTVQSSKSIDTAKLEDVRAAVELMEP